MSLNYFSILMVINLLVFSLTSVSAENKAESLPEPLTLELALSLIDQQHPDLRYADANLQNAYSNLQQILSYNYLSVNLKVDARWIEPSAFALNQSTEDHQLSFLVNKTLYDFGRNAIQTNVASQIITSQKLFYLNAQQHQYIMVMKRYFNVVLADLQFYRYNEEMAVAYIQFDRMKNRKNLGQNTEIDVMEKEVEYQRIRRLRTFSENQQRVTRSLLAQALNKPNNSPTTLTRPELDVISRKLPEIELLQKAVKENNPRLRALRASLIAAQNNIQFAHSDSKPLLSGGLGAFSYARRTNSSEVWSVNITLDVPLWSGGRVDAAVAKAKATVYKIEAQLAQQELMAQQQVLELWLGIETLKIKYAEVLVAVDLSELSLDKNRVLYDLEVKTDLGYSMVKFSEAERKVEKTKFDIALAWAELDALSGRLLTKQRK